MAWVFLLLGIFVCLLVLLLFGIVTLNMGEHVLFLSNVTDALCDVVSWVSEHGVGFYSIFELICVQKNQILTFFYNQKNRYCIEEEKGGL